MTCSGPALTVDGAKDGKAQRANMKHDRAKAQRRRKSPSPLARQMTSQSRRRDQTCKEAAVSSCVAGRLMKRPGGRPTWRLKAVLKVLAEP